jgi:hypothetical protein
MKRLSLTVLTLSIILPACIPFGDPGNPTAEGVVSLDGIEVVDETHLYVLMYPDTGDTFDPTVIPGPEERNLSVISIDMDSSFPIEYVLRDGLGTSDHRDWRLVAWLSVDWAEHSEDTAWIASGEAFGTVTFEAEDCGPGYRGYCGEVLGVDVSIDTIAP